MSGLTISWEEKRVISEVLSDRDANRRLVGMSDTPGGSLLDSSLIIEYNDLVYTQQVNKLYNCKLIKCGDYVQLYFYEKSLMKKKKGFEKVVDIENELIKEENVHRLGEQKFIEYRNIQRAKLNLQRLVKTNEKVFKTFITLTFAENLQDIKEANKKLHNWICNIRKLKKDFKFVCVPEYQKRGAVHYHLMTNIEITDTTLLSPQKKRTKKTKHLKHIYDVRYWDKGFARVDDLRNIDNVTAYITKYMTKDADNRLFGSRKYHYSRNLEKPIEEYIDLTNENEFEYIKKLTKNCELKFNNKYKNTYNQQDMLFIEYKNALVDIIIIIRNDLTFCVRFFFVRYT